MLHITTKSGKKIATLGDEALRITKSVEALSDLNNIQKEAALRVSLPFDVLFLDKKEVDVVVRTGTFVLPYTKLVTTSWDAAAQLFEAELVGSHWIEQFDTLFLADLALGTFDFTVANVMATWSSTGIITFPVVDYGNFVNPAYPSIEDLRPLLQVKAILEKAFCKVGYTFSCPYLDTNAGKMQYGYYLKKEKTILKMKLQEEITCPNCCNQQSFEIDIDCIRARNTEVQTNSYSCHEAITTVSLLHVAVSSEVKRKVVCVPRHR